jgi:hypothetical protein
LKLVARSVHLSLVQSSRDDDKADGSNDGARVCDDFEGEYDV